MDRSRTPTQHIRAIVALIVCCGLSACPGSNSPPSDAAVEARTVDTAGDRDGAHDLTTPLPDGPAKDAPPSCATCTAPSVCVGNVCHSYPQRRVGIFYLAWHAFAADAMQQIAAPQRYTVEDVVRKGLSFDDLLPTAALQQQAASFRYHVRPTLGFYCMYRKRAGEAPYTEPDLVPDCPNITTTARTHAQQLWSAGVDFVFVDLTNLQQMSPFADVLGVRPLEVLLEEWSAARAAGVMTPQVAAWVPAPAKSGSMVYEKVLELYNNPTFAPLILHDAKSGKRVMFLVDYLTVDASRQLIESNGGKNDIVGVRLWGLLGGSKLSAGVASWMQPCESGGKWMTIIEAQTPCAQGYSPGTPIGSVLSVSTSYQLSYASLPFRAAGRRGGLTLKKQFQRAFTVQPDVLLINSWNEQIAQPQPNNYSAAMGNLRKSMGVYDASGVALWVDAYGAEYVRDVEPTVEYGSQYYDLMASCVRVYRLGGCTAPAAASEGCCQLQQDFQLIRSLRLKDPTNQMTTHHVLSTGTNERDVLVATGAWEEVCTPFDGVGQLCGGGEMTNADLPFELYAQPGSGRALLTRCYTGASNFFSLDPACEGTSVVGPLGYLSQTRDTSTARPLRRCYNTVAQRHFHWLDVGCPALPNVKQETQLGFVR
jgi:hypothetical protein